MRHRLATCCVIVSLLPAAAAAQTPSASRERLSLDAAIKMAVEHNRTIESARLQIAKAEDDLAVARTRRLPIFETSVKTSQLLTPVTFAFPQGAFGDFPGIGPVPAANTEVTTPRRPNTYLSGQLSQPLSQLIRINLGIRSAAAARDIEREKTRERQLSLVADVKRLYFAILQTESALRATADAIALYQELDRSLEVRVAQKVALKADALDVRFRLAQEELARLTSTNALASQKEQLNQLLGRDIRTIFDVEGVAPLSGIGLDLGVAQARALENRPDVREARLRVEQADLDRRLKKAGRIPDVSLAVSYMSNFNLDVLPQNLAAVGVEVMWEPFDWGRKGRELAAKMRTLEQARLAVRDVEDRALVEINSRYRKLQETRALLGVAELAQTAVREKLRVKTSQFQVQAAMLADVLRVRAELADTDDQYQQALLGFWTATADFEQAMGEEVIR